MAMESHYNPFSLLEGALSKGNWVTLSLCLWPLDSAWLIVGL